MRFPFISREHSNALVAAKDSELAAQRAYSAKLEELLAIERQAREEGQKRLEAIIERSLPVAKKSAAREHVLRHEEKPATLDLAMVDPYDNEALALIVAQEIPPGTRSNGIQLQRAIERLRGQVIAAKEARNESVGGTRYVPALVQEQIEQAVKAGERAHG